MEKKMDSNTRFDRIEGKLDVLDAKLDSKLDIVNDKLDDYNKQLVLHIEGTVQNRNIAVQHTEAIKKLYTEMEVVVEHVNFMRNIKKFLLTFLKTLSVLASVVGAVVGAFKLFKGA